MKRTPTTIMRVLFARAPFAKWHRAVTHGSITRLCDQYFSTIETQYLLSNKNEIPLRCTAHLARYRVTPECSFVPWETTCMGVAHERVPTKHDFNRYYHFIIILELCSFQRKGTRRIGLSFVCKGFVGRHSFRKYSGVVSNFMIF